VNVPGRRRDMDDASLSDVEGDGARGNTKPILQKKMATSASQLFLRRVAVQVLSAASTAILARKLGVSGFGDYSAGLAMYYLALSICDFGFGNVLARELGKGRADDGRLVRSMLRVQTAWSALVGLGVVGFVIAVGLSAVRMQVLLVLVPAVALFGLSGVRQVFYASYKTGRLGLIDVATNVAQLIVVAGLALAGGGPLCIAIGLSAMIVVNSIVVTVAGLRLVDVHRSTGAVRRRMLFDSLPLGLSSLLCSAYFTIDLSIVSFLVSSRELGYYAAATKALSVLVTIPGLVMSAVLPGLASHAGSPKELGALASRVWHWLSAVALPMCIAVILFAPPFVHIFYGKEFLPAIPLVRVLAVSGIIALLSNLFAAAMIVTRRNRWLIIQGAIALVFNVVGNFVLVPHYGVSASAWLTVATELGVCCGSITAMYRHLDFAPMLKTTVVPAVAAGAMIVAWIATSRWFVPSIVVSGVVYVGTLSVLGGWPEELPRLFPSRLVLWKLP